MNSFEIVYLNFDGSSKPNPGEMTSGYLIRDEQNKLIHSETVQGGHGTSNQAEYIGLYHGVKKVVEMGYKHVIITGDSQVVIFQVLGKYKCEKHPKLIAHRNNIIELLNQLYTYELRHVKRKFNKEADKLTR